MLSQSLVFLKDQLNHHLNIGRDPDEVQEASVVFIKDQNSESITFKQGAVTILLINLEEENTLRPPNQYAQISPNGERQNINPEIRLVLYVLFVAHFKEYDESLECLSRIIRYFQKNRVMTQGKFPELSENIDKLVFELITLPFSEQNEVWSALRAAYHPSVIYKVRMVVFHDEDTGSAAPAQEIVAEISS